MFQITQGKEPSNSKGEKVASLGEWIPAQLDLGFLDLFTNEPELKARGSACCQRRLKALFAHNEVSFRRSATEIHGTSAEENDGRGCPDRGEAG
jgi:hypothetical protein